MAKDKQGGHRWNSTAIINADLRPWTQGKRGRFSAVAARPCSGWARGISLRPRKPERPGKKVAGPSARTAPTWPRLAAAVERNPGEAGLQPARPAAQAFPC